MTARRVAIAIAAGAAAILAGCALWIARPLPAGLVARDPLPSVVLLDRDGVPLRATRAPDGTLARWIPFDEMDPRLVTAFIAAEDQRFFAHHGVDVHAVLRALRDNVRAGHVVSGASTITMQTARLAHPTGRDWAGKLAQALWALRLERHLDKRTILEQYLNRVPLGQGSVGVGAASELYFGASAAKLSLAQAAELAGLAHAPSAENPLVAPARARRRRDDVLARMAHMGFASASDVARARAEPVRAAGVRAAFLAPHFTTRVLLWSAGVPAPGLGAPRDGGHAVSGVVRTSLDLTLQREIEQEVRHTVFTLRDRGAEHAAAVVLDNRTGEILAWVGSPDFFDDTAGQTDMVVSPRQPGSALKPFLYGLAFDRGFTPASILPDVERTFATATGAYRPRDYDRRTRGPVRAREALGSSYNIPAVVLADSVGVSALLATLHAAGFTSLEHSAEYYGLGLALGNGDVTLLELANAYRALANGGEWRPYRWTAVGARAGVAGEAPRRVMSPMAAALVTDVLADADARAPGFGLATPFDFPFRAAVKTGTSRHFTDNWAVAVTEGFTVAVWAGNFSGRPMHGVSGVSGAGPLLRRAVLRTAARHPPGRLRTPAEAGAEAVRICRLSGLLEAHGCPSMTEWFAPGTAPVRLDDWYADGAVALPPEYAQWASEDAARSGDARPVAGAMLVSSRAGGQSERDSASVARLHIVSPRDGDRFGVPPGVDSAYATVGLRAAGAADGGVRWFVDGVPYAATRLRLVRGAHVIVAANRSGERDEVRITVE
ncbi:MAG TPA: penicillin-binding protein 1C [Gemmatimonadaceae bacterium]|nr:penicillin-binding protein 1C [Gemmatimonadaceae bacterium]